MGRIPIYRKVGDVFVKIEEVDSTEFDWLVDEDDVEILVAYIIDELEDSPDSEEERRVYEFHVEL